MHIEPLDPDTAPETALRAWYDGVAAVRRPRAPLGAVEPYEALVAMLRHAPSLAPDEHWVVRDGDRVAGYGWFSWYETDENKHRLDVMLDAPEDGEEVVRELLRAAVRSARTHGKSLVAFEVYGGAPEGAALAEAGATLAIVDQRNVVAMADLDPATLRELIAECEAGAPEYDIVSFDDYVPDEWIDQYLAVKDAMNGAPRGEMDWEDVNYTREKQRAFEKSSVARGVTRWMACARHRETNTLVGLTELLVWMPKAMITWQGDTTVVPEHRGHRLGLWIKAVNLLRVVTERPDSPGVLTWNADTNDFMIGVNRALGFTLHDRVETLEIPTDSLAAALGL